MLVYLGKRLAMSLLILLGVTFVTFCPHVPDARRSGGDDRRPQLDGRRSARRSATQLGLDQPLPVQYVGYVGRLAHGDFGRSYARKTDVGELIWSRLPATLLLMLGAIVAELLIGIPAGIYAASRRGTAHGQGGDDAVVRRRLGAAVRGRPVAALCLRLLARLAAARRLRHLRPPDPAGADPRDRRRRLVLADDALVDGRCAAPGLHPHRAGQGRAGMAGAC